MFHYSHQPSYSYAAPSQHHHHHPAATAIPSVYPYALALSPPTVPTPAPAPATVRYTTYPLTVEDDYEAEELALQQRLAELRSIRQRAQRQAALEAEAENKRVEQVRARVEAQRAQAEAEARRQVELQAAVKAAIVARQRAEEEEEERRQFAAFKAYMHQQRQQQEQQEAHRARQLEAQHRAREAAQLEQRRRQEVAQQQAQNAAIEKKNAAIANATRQRQHQHQIQQQCAAVERQQQKQLEHQERANVQEQLEKQFWEMIFGGQPREEVPIEKKEKVEEKKQEQKTGCESRGPCVRFATQPTTCPMPTIAKPASPVPAPVTKPATPPPTASAQTTSSTADAPIRDLKDFLKQAFGVDVQFNISHGEDNEKSKAQEAKPEPVKVKEAAPPAPAQEQKKQFSEQKQVEEQIPEMLGNLLSAFFGRDVTEGLKEKVEAKKEDIKGKGKAREEPIATIPAVTAPVAPSQEKKQDQMATPAAATAEPSSEEGNATFQAAYQRNATRVSRLEKLESLSSKLDKYTANFTFPERLDFLSHADSVPSSPSLDPVDSPSSDVKPSLRVPPLAFSHNNQPYHAQAQALMGLLTEADAIPSDGEKDVRKARKEFVKKVEAELGRMEVQRGKVYRAQSKEDEPVEADAPVTAANNETEGYTVEPEVVSKQDITAEATPEVIFEAAASPEVQHIEVAEEEAESLETAGASQEDVTPTTDHKPSATTTEAKTTPEDLRAHVEDESDAKDENVAKILEPKHDTEQAAPTKAQVQEVVAPSETEESTRSYSSSDESDDESSKERKDEDFELI